MHRPALSLSLALLITTPGQAALLTAWSDAQRNDPTFLAAVAQRDADIEELPLARAQLLPQITASASQGHASSDITQPGALGKTTTSSRDYATEAWALQLRQAIFRSRALIGYQQGKAVARAAEATLAASRQTLALRLIEAAANIAWAEASLRAADTGITETSTLVQLTRRQLRAGEMTRHDVAQASARLAQMRQTRSQAMADLQEAQAGWQAITGQASAPQLFLDPDVCDHLPMPAASPAAMFAIAQQSNPALRAAHFERDAAHMESRKAQGERLPSVDLVASHAFNDSDSDNAIGSRFETLRYGIQVSMPLFSGGALSAGIRQAEARERRSGVYLQDMESKARQLIAREAALLEAARQEAERARADEAAARLGVQAAALGLGRIATVADLANARIALATAERDLVHAGRASLSSWARLHDVMGSLDDAEVEQVARITGWNN